MTFEDGSNISKVVVGCAGWASPNADTIAVGGVTKTPVQGGVNASVEEIEFAFEAVDSFSILTTKRIIINYISVYAVVS